jgi:hypothetical protein
MCRGEDKFIQDFVDKICSKEDTCKSSHRYEDNIKMYLKEMGWDDMYWVQLAQDRDELGCCEHCNEWSGSIK